MTDNGPQVLLCDGIHGYIYTLATNTLEPITDEDFVPGTHVAFVDGYFCIARTGNGPLRGISALYNGLVWDATEFVTAEAAPDPILALATLNRIVWAFGTHSIQGFFHAGAVDFPFTPLQGAELHEGILAPYTLQVMGDGGLVWLGRDAAGGTTVQRLAGGGGYQLQRLSTHAIEFALTNTPDLAQARAWQYHREGHHFYCLATQTHTWCWDLSTGLWHERALLNAQGRLEPLPIGLATFAFGDTVVLGDVLRGRLYTLDDAVYTYAARSCRRFASGRARVTSKARCTIMSWRFSRDGGGARCGGGPAGLRPAHGVAVQ